MVFLFGALISFMVFRWPKEALCDLLPSALVVDR